MTGRYETLRKINQNTFSVYIASGRDLQDALVPGPVQAAHGQVTYLYMGHDLPFLNLPPTLRHKTEFRKIEGFSGLIGAIRSDESVLLFIQHSLEHMEDYESSIHVLAEECRSHARHVAPVVILSVSHDDIIEELGTCSDRFIIFTDKTRRSVAGRRNHEQKTLTGCPWPADTSCTQKQVHRYGQQPLTD
ncbi:MAG TPA: cell wall-binding repeat-containing protein [Methanospirillum sp.]|uniref:cell wall-binding repeat-containing protein n=1 Tax=Methanospirillum sp. TaxID=45200 RepID=UPI002C62E1A2|nr:cell wall-binding repeat-containing protein [Methanospirillum sp.]HPY59135.1 cell wall-binding repeat-containing protein [Methanospirillum sp.]